jgi:hypothetical protein
VKQQLRRARYYQAIIDTLEAERWTQLRDTSSAPVVHVSAQMAEAEAGVRDVKTKLRV